MSEWITEALTVGINDAELVPIDFQGEIGTYREPVLPWNYLCAMDFARNYCDTTAPCGTHYAGEGGDCAHFLAHVLQAGGLRIIGGSGACCPHGLNIRAGEVASALARAAATYENVSEIGSYLDTTHGDFGFLRSFYIPWHSFILKSKPSASGGAAQIYAHSNNRCGEEVQADFAGARYFRIG